MPFGCSTRRRVPCSVASTRPAFVRIAADHEPAAMNLGYVDPQGNIYCAGSQAAPANRASQAPLTCGAAVGLLGSMSTDVRTERCEDCGHHVPSYDTIHLTVSAKQS